MGYVAAAMEGPDGRVREVGPEGLLASQHAGVDEFLRMLAAQARLALEREARVACRPGAAAEGEEEEEEVGDMDEGGGGRRCAWCRRVLEPMDAAYCLRCDALAWEADWEAWEQAGLR